MLRMPLIAVLALLVALPHGICFCDLLHAEPPHSDSCCETQAPYAPIQPTDDADDHERDCPCKLREVLAVSPAPAPLDLDDVSFSILTDAANASLFAVMVGDLSRSSSFMPYDGPVPLTVRALRI